MKEVSIPDFEKTIALIQNMEMDVECNVMVGLPFLSEKEQYEDALSTIQWVFEHQCTPVLFPVNIKPYTLLISLLLGTYHHRTCLLILRCHLAFSTMHLILTMHLNCNTYIDCFKIAKQYIASMTLSIGA